MSQNDNRTIAAVDGTTSGYNICLPHLFSLSEANLFIASVEQSMPQAQTRAEQKALADQRLEAFMKDSSLEPSSKAYPPATEQEVINAAKYRMAVMVADFEHAFITSPAQPDGKSDSRT